MMYEVNINKLKKLKVGRKSSRIIKDVMKER